MNEIIFSHPVTVAELAKKFKELENNGLGDCQIYLEMENSESALHEISILEDGGDGTCLLRSL